jgi:hypothetical protein
MQSRSVGKLVRENINLYIGRSSSHFVGKCFHFEQHSMPSTSISNNIMRSLGLLVGLLVSMGGPSW